MSRIVLLFAFVFGWSDDLRAQGVVINEVMASNSRTLADEDGDFEDWIELFNGGAEPVDLGGFGLSDDVERPFRWVLPDTTIAPGGFLLVWASGKDRSNGGTLHTNFSIAAAGEELLLTDPEGQRVDGLDPTPVPTDMSFGRWPDGSGEWYFFDEPTPAASNTSQGYLGILDAPVLSREGGFYTEGFSLEVSVSHPGASVHYTTDGRPPTDSSTVYDAPIEIVDRTGEPHVLADIQTAPDEVWLPPESDVFLATVVRAQARAEGYLPSEVITKTYLVSPDVFDRFGLPVVSVSTDPHGFFDYVDGIYVPGKIYDDRYNPNSEYWNRHANYRQRGSDWERPIHLEFYDPDGSHGFSMNAGVRMHGGASRSNPRKSMRVYFRSDYDEESWLEYPLFPGHDVERFKRIVLRNSGNDWGASIFRDALMQTLVQHIGFETQAYRPAVVLLNGEYWGIHNIRERYDTRYLEAKYGIDPDDVDMLESVNIVVEGDNRHYQEMLDSLRIRHQRGESIVDYASTMMDVEDFTAYQLSQIYFANTDWPGNNNMSWRKRTAFHDPDAPIPHDGRWRWMLYDTDFGFNLFGQTPSHNTLDFALEPDQQGWPNPAWSTELFRILVSDDDFLHSFVNTFADHLNTTFVPDRVVAVIDSFEAVLEHAMPEHIQRWRRPSSPEAWANIVEQLRMFGRERPDHQRTHIVQQFGLGGTHTLTVDVSDRTKGHLRVNTVEIDEATIGLPDPGAPYPWSGTYFEDVPVTITAVPEPGYRLVSWEGVDGARATSTLVVSLEEDLEVTAVFAPYDPAVPDPHELKEGSYVFTRWDPAEPEGSYPSNMAFLQSRVIDPSLDAEMDDLYLLPYDLEERTRIVGLAEGGFAFINTGTGDDVEEGTEGRDLGAALLAIDASECRDVSVVWSGTTVRPNDREYAIRLQYRIGDDGSFMDVLDPHGRPVEYVRNPVSGHREVLGPAVLNEDLDDQPYVQLRWTYHYTGEGDSGPRAMLAVSDVQVSATCGPTSGEPDRPDLGEFRLDQNYPNPFNPSTRIDFHLPAPAHARLRVYDMLGRLVATLVDEPLPRGPHSVAWKSGDLPSGVYFYRLNADGLAASRTMVLMR